jgi:hypothetical protein
LGASSFAGDLGARERGELAVDFVGQQPAGEVDQALGAAALAQHLGHAGAVLDDERLALLAGVAALGHQARLAFAAHHLHAAVEERRHERALAQRAQAAEHGRGDAGTRLPRGEVAQADAAEVAGQAQASGDVADAEVLVDPGRGERVLRLDVTTRLHRQAAAQRADGALLDLGQVARRRAECARHLERALQLEVERHPATAGNGRAHRRNLVPNISCTAIAGMPSGHSRKSDS